MRIMTHARTHLLYEIQCSNRQPNSFNLEYEKSQQIETMTIAMIITDEALAT